MDHFMPHGHCFLWRADLLGLHVVSDTIIALSYFSIPAAIYYFTKRRSVQNRIVPTLFIAFIITCGITHLFTIWNFWNADYWLSGAFKALCALISLTTAVFLWLLMPKALRVPSIAEYENVTKELKQTKDNLENRVYRKTQILGDIILDLENLMAMMNHDFRNGLSAINSSVDLVRLAKSKEEQEENMERIKRATNRLMDLTDTISTKGSSSLRRDALCDLNKLIGELKDSYAPVLKTIGGEVRVSPLPELKLNKTLIFQLFSNLISNSIKYRDPNRPLQIRVHSTEESQFYNIYFEDNGTGISENDQAKIFELNFRSSDPKKREATSGHGVGLSFCHQICKMHGGEIKVENAKGPGATFIVKLPKT